MKRYIKYHLKPRTKPTYKWHPTKSMRGSLITLGVVIALIIYWGNTQSNLAYATGQANMASSLIAQKDTRVEELASENEALKNKLAASANIKIDDKTRKVVEYYIFKYFGTEADKAKKVFTCESGLNPNTVHTNKPGLAADYGIAQINPIWHKARFEKLTGANFDVGIYDVEMNVRYAKWLRDNSGWSQWVCSKLI